MTSSFKMRARKEVHFLPPLPCASYFPAPEQILSALADVQVVHLTLTRLVFSYFKTQSIRQVYAAIRNPSELKVMLLLKSSPNDWRSARQSRLSLGKKSGAQHEIA